MTKLIKEINKLNMEEAMLLNEVAFNKANKCEYNSAEYNQLMEISNLATKRFVKLYVASKKLKGSASLEFGKYQTENAWGEFEDRVVTVDMTVRADSEEAVEEAFEKLSEQLKALADVEVKWACCPVIEEDNKGWYYTDMFSIPYEHGEMTSIKKDIRKAFAEAKKGLGLK